MQCPSCGVDALAGSRWCSVCHVNLLDPSLGRLASPGKRLGAYVLDVVLPVVIILLLIGVSGAAGAASERLGMTVLVLGLIGFLLGELLLFARGTTPGKAALGMRVVKEDGRPAGFLTMLLREWIGKLISGFFLGVGYLWIVLDRDRQAWHDKLASTYVVER